MTFTTGGLTAFADALYFTRNKYLCKSGRCALLRSRLSLHFAEVIPLEGKGQFAKMLGGVTSERHGEVEAESDLPTAVIGELIELLVFCCHPPSLLWATSTPVENHGNL
jgi:hypothetical protein